MNVSENAAKSRIIQKPVYAALKLDPSVLEKQIFERFTQYSEKLSQRKKRAESARENFGKPGREVKVAVPLFEAIADAYGWRPYLEDARIKQKWKEIAGENVAYNCQPKIFRDGVLEICARSTNYSVQIKYYVPQIQKNLKEVVPEINVERIEVTGPQNIKFEEEENNNSGRTVRKIYR